MAFVSKKAVDGGDVKDYVNGLDERTNTEFGLVNGNLTKLNAPEIMRADFPDGSVGSGQIYNATYPIDKGTDFIKWSSGSIQVQKTGLFRISASIFLSTRPSVSGDRLWLQVLHENVVVAQSIVYPSVGSSYITINIPSSIVSLGAGIIKTVLTLEGYTTVNINGGATTGASFVCLEKV